MKVTMESLTKKLRRKKVEAERYEKRCDSMARLGMGVSVNEKYAAVARAKAKIYKMILRDHLVFNHGGGLKPYQESDDKHTEKVSPVVQPRGRIETQSASSFVSPVFNHGGGLKLQE